MSRPGTWSVQVEGLAELERKLNEFGPMLAKKSIRKALAKGTRLIANEATSNAPIRTGTLRRAIYVKRATERKTPWSETYIVGVRRGKKYQAKGKDAFYFPFVEFRTKHSNRNKPDGERFMTNAFKTKSSAANDLVKQVLLEEVERLASKKP